MFSRCTRARLYTSITRSNRPNALHRIARWKSSTQQASESTSKNGQHHAAKGRSVRPFTVLALCIPLGYAVSWSLGRDNKSTTADNFVKYRLISKEDVSSTCSIFTFVPKAAACLDLTVREGGRMVRSVLVKQPQLQIARSYTLLPRQAGGGDDEVQLLIRKEPRGEVSGHLHRLPLDADVELRGPHVDFVLPEEVGRVVFLAGGTGITPAMQVAAGLREGERMHVLWANRREEDCRGGRSDSAPAAGWWPSMAGWFTTASPASEAGREICSDAGTNGIVARLDHMKREHPSDLLVDYLVDETGTFIDARTVQRLLRSDTTQPTASNAGKKVVFVSGPEGFVSYWAGPKQWMNGHEVQGPLGGVLSTLDTSGWTIVKL